MTEVSDIQNDDLDSLESQEGIVVNGLRIKDKRHLFARFHGFRNLHALRSRDRDIGSREKENAEEYAEDTSEGWTDADLEEEVETEERAAKSSMRQTRMKQIMDLRKHMPLQKLGMFKQVGVGEGEGTEESDSDSGSDSDSESEQENRRSQAFSKFWSRRKNELKAKKATRTKDEAEHLHKQAEHRSGVELDEGKKTPMPRWKGQNQEEEAEEKDDEDEDGFDQDDEKDKEEDGWFLVRGLSDIVGSIVGSFTSPRTGNLFVKREEEAEGDREAGLKVATEGGDRQVESQSEAARARRPSETPSEKEERVGWLQNVQAGGRTRYDGVRTGIGNVPDNEQTPRVSDCQFSCCGCTFYSSVTFNRNR